MSVYDVVSKIRFYAQARRDIQADRNLSEQGKKRQGDNLEQSIQLFRGTALVTLQQAWKDIRQQAKDIQEQRERAERLESERWNYDKLSYEVNSAERQLASFSTLEEVTSWLKTALPTGNLERQRAVLETTPGVVLKRFSSVVGTGSLVKQLERQLAVLMSTPELAQVEQAEREGGNAVMRLVHDTEEISQFYEPPSLWGGSADFSRLLSNVRITRKINPESWNAFETTTIDFVEPEPAGV